MNRGKRLKLLPFTVLLTALSFTVYVPGIVLMQTARKEISSEIKEIEKQIEDIEARNNELAIELEQLRQG
ncbi:MAG: hypothetical protein IKG55_01070 [Solobacterium sp.]|nr:hypothetical protein [Solobacterium sp.]